MNQGIQMFKIVMILTMTMMGMSLFTGCTQPDVPINNRQATWNQSNEYQHRHDKDIDHK